MILFRACFRLLLIVSILSCTASTAPPSRPAEAPKPVNRLTPLGVANKIIAEPKIRVGLVTDASSYTFKRIPDGYIIVSDSGPSQIRRGFSLKAPLAGATVTYAVQVAALSDRSSADALVAKVSGEGFSPVDVSFDGSLYRVLVGNSPESAVAEPIRGDLIQRGYAREIVVVRRPSPKEFQTTIQLVDDEGDQYTLSSSSLLVLPAVAEGIEIEGKPYRGGARVFINNRGLFNIVNELNLEDYLRGNVPNELGPRVYDELEAIKAQTLAARTYAVRRLGEFRIEGYDICPTPACQVYNGMSTEEAMSDQAVRETAGMIITYQGEPIDALYTSTCGGYTSDVSTMFPGRTDPYLKRASCIEMEMTTIAGRGDSQILSEMQADARVFASLAQVPDRLEGWNANYAVSFASKAAAIAGIALDPAPIPRSIRRGDLLEYLGTAWNFARFGDVLTLPEDRQYFFPESDWNVPQAVAAAFLVKYRSTPTQHLDRIDLSAPMPREEYYALLYSWLKRNESVKEISGKIASVSGQVVTLKAEGKKTPYTLPDGVPMLRKLGERVQEYASLPIMIGDRATILTDRGGRPVAMLVLANYDGASFDRTSSYSSWIRSYRADELVTMISRRNTITQLIGIRPLSWDASKRVKELEVTAEGNRKIVLSGLHVRWSLGVPDNLFVYQLSKDNDGVDRYTFYGKGWGHGVGMCQVGAYGMAFRGKTAEQIIKNYYSDVEIVRWR